MPNAPKKDLDDLKCPTPSSTIKIKTTKHIWEESPLSGESKQPILGQFNDDNERSPGDQTWQSSSSGVQNGVKFTG